MEINYGLRLPREVATVPVVRGLIRTALAELRVRPSCVADVALALTEACANVVEHASDADDEFEVRVQIDSTTCQIRVIDTGGGFDHAAIGTEMPNTDAERGRGIVLMQALVDNVRFESLPEDGTVVHLVKALELEDDSPLYLAGLTPRT
jgi:serine/threonine-protein kinase RsbW